MDLFEELAKLKVEKAMKAIEVAARVMEEAGERLRRRAEYWETWNNEVGWAADVKFREAANKYAHATTKEDRENAEDEMLYRIDEVASRFEEGAHHLEEDAKEDEEARRSAQGHGTLEGHLHR